MSYARPVRPAPSAARGASSSATSTTSASRGAAGTASGTASDRPGARAAAGLEPPVDYVPPEPRVSVRRPAERDLRRAGTMAAGIVLGALIGAGVALLLAPMSGADTRQLIARRSRALRDDAGDRWSALGDELRAATRRRRRKVRRGVTRGRWAVADLLDE